MCIFGPEPKSKLNGFELALHLIPLVSLRRMTDGIGSVTSQRNLSGLESVKIPEKSTGLVKTAR